MSKWTERYAAVVQATRTGSLPKASERKCERCGEQATHRHHDDYSRPLDVNFFCNPCHHRRHAELGWGIAGRMRTRAARQPFIKPEPKYSALLHIQPFDFVLMEGKSVGYVSQLANAAAKKHDAAFKCFSVDGGTVVFRLQ